MASTIFYEKLPKGSKKKKKSVCTEDQLFRHPLFLLADRMPVNKSTHIGTPRVETEACWTNTDTPSVVA